ncbi:MAG: hypothetical protein DRP08_00680 [Candidatus Aenigmatarchaeota archaeon]|nr:MAG: hypothetical protein DRP08_00680 [Candidatus Aenigmarchaeota archaeon]
MKMVNDKKECPYKKICSYSHCPKNFHECFEFLRHRAAERKKFFESGTHDLHVNKKVIKFWEKSAERDIKPIRWKPKKIK